MAKLPWITKDFIRAIPKSDLHVHLDGSLRLGTLIELAKKQKLKLPSMTESGLRELVFKPHYADLSEYLHGFKYTCAVLRDPESLEQVAYELAWDNFEEGVRYIEPRFAPQLNAHKKMNIEEVLLSVDKGLRRAQREINKTPNIVSGKEPSFEYGMIGCAMRKFNENFSEYYRDFVHVHSHTPIEELYPIASLEIARALVKIRDTHGIPIVGFDLAGEEKGFPAEDHQEAYNYAHKNFLQKTVHAGEAYGPPSIFQAVTDLHADRIGHGTHLFSIDLIRFGKEETKNRYLNNLIKYIADSRITIEVCLSCNIQTIPGLREIKNHPVKKMLERRLSITFCTDNRLVSHTTVSEEIEKALKNFDISEEHLKDIIIYGFKRSFFPHSYKEKRDYVRSVINYYESVEARFKNASQSRSK